MAWLTGWRYAPVADSEDASRPGKKSLAHNARECVNSKAFWRILLLLVTIGLFANVLSPAKSQLQKYGWVSEGQNVDGSSAGSEILEHPTGDDVDWSQYAYCQYVTSEDYLCNSLMIFESLTRLGAKAELLMMYPEEWVVGDSSIHGRLLAKARDSYGVRLQPIHVQKLEGEKTWAESFTKLLAFNQTRYQRVLSLDSDSTILQPMDELFLLPSAPVAMPRAYWLDTPYLSSQLVLVEPSEFEFHRIQETFETRGKTDFDMEIVNELYGASCFIIPHRKYDLLTGEFKSPDHSKYLGSEEEEWDPEKALAEAKFLHFSDYPQPKPWISVPNSVLEMNKPLCMELEDGTEDCRDQEKWLWFYSDFLDRRKRVCGMSPAKRGLEEAARSPVFKWR